LGCKFYIISHLQVTLPLLEKNKAMKKINFYSFFLALLIILLPGCSSTRESRDVLYQTSTFNALLAGVFEGNITYRELKKYGDFGIGTFDSLDGEMIAMDGKFYQIKADGFAYDVDDEMKTPFALVTFFQTDNTFLLDKPMELKQIEEYLDNLLPTKNIILGIKIKGVFSYIKTRSVPRQNKPYPPIAEVIKNQPVFEFHNVKGTMVGFRVPEYMNGINVTGYHLHFISEDGRKGGHVLEYTVKNAKAEIDYTHKLYLVLPENREFYKMDQTRKIAN